MRDSCCWSNLLAISDKLLAWLLRGVDPECSIPIDSHKWVKVEPKSATPWSVIIVFIWGMIPRKVRNASDTGFPLSWRIGMAQI